MNTVSEPRLPASEILMRSLAVGFAYAIASALAALLLGPLSRLAATIDLGFPPDVYYEQGAGIWICGPRTTSWADIWSRFRNLG